MAMLNFLLSAPKHPGKQLCVLAFLTIIVIQSLHGQYQCSTAIFLVPDTVSDYNIDSNVYWFQFTPTDSSVFLHVGKSPVDSLPALHSLVLYQGTCTGLLPLDTIDFTAEDSSLFRSDYMIDSNYYLKLTVQNQIYGPIQMIYIPTTFTSTICPHTDCNLIPNGSFMPANLSPLLTMLFAPPYNLTDYYLQQTSLFNQNYEVCGWASSIYSVRLQSANLNVPPTNLYMILKASYYHHYARYLVAEVNGGNLLSLNDSYLFRFKYLRTSTSADHIECGLTAYPDENSIFSPNNYSLYSAVLPLTFPMNQYLQVEQVFTLPNAYYQNKKYFFIYVRNYYNSATNGEFYVDDFEIIPAIKSISANQVICAGESVPLVVEPCLNDEDHQPNYSWSSNPYDASLQSQVSFQSIVVTPNVTTTYTAYVSYSNGLHGTRTVVVYVNPLPVLPEISGSFIAYEPDQNYSIDNYDSQNDYFLDIYIDGSSVIPGLIQLSQGIFSIDWSQYSFGNSNYATIIITVVEPNGGCSSEARFDVFNCCQGQYDFLWIDKAIGSGNYSNNTISINGVLTIDDNSTVSFAGCEFFMGGNAQIIVGDNCQVTIEESTFHSCDNLNMWDGIYNTYENSSLTATGNEFYDAKNAIVNRNGANYEIINNYFDLNLVCLKLEDNTGQLDGSVYSNTFTASTQLNLYPHIGENSEYGIWIKDLVNSGFDEVQIGSAADPSFYNQFFSIDTAIRIVNSDVEIINNLFTDHKVSIRVTGEDNDPNLDARLLIVGGGDPSEENYLRLGEYGILVDGKATTKIYHNTINRFATGVEISNSFMTDHYIAYNTIDSFLIHGIFMTNLGSDIQIKENLIGPNMIGKHFASIGIAVTLNQDPGNGYVAQSQICRNEIGNYGSGQIMVGIHASENYKLTCGENNIHMNSAGWTVPRIGIIATGQPGGLISSNNLTFNNYFSALEYAGELRNGIVINYSPFSVLGGNSISNYCDGIRVIDYNLPSNFTCNMITDYYYGFRLGNAVISNQGSTSPQNVTFDNQWYFNNTPFNGNYRAYGSIMSGASVNWYYDSPTFMTLNTGQWNVTGLFSTQNITPSQPYNCLPFSCDPTPPAPIAPPPPGGGIQNLQAYNDRNAELEPIRNFLQSANTNLSPSAGLQDAIWSAKYHLYQRLMQHPEYLNTGAANDTVYQQIYQSMPSDNPGRVALFNSNMFKGDSIVALQTNYAFTPINTFEKNFAHVQDVYTRNWSMGRYSLSSADSSILLGIAMSDPATEGEAVFMARDMLRMLVWDNSTISPRMQPQDVVIPSRNAIEVFPNPSDGHLTIRFNMEEYSCGSFLLYDLTGRYLNEVRLEDVHEQEIQLGELKPGVYLYVIRTNFGMTQSGKLIIHR